MKKQVLLATTIAFLAIAFQVAAKATRDGVFLANFSVSTLPTVVAVSAFLSLLATLAMSRALVLWGPARVVPLGFGLSSAFLLAQYFLALVSPRAAALTLYLHVAALGGFLISGFWSLISESFDPRTAKKNVSRIAMGATLGGISGGLLVERLAALGQGQAVLPGLAVMHLGCALLLFGLRSAGTTEELADTSWPGAQSGYSVLLQSTYLRQLACLVLLATMSANFLDYVFKSAAAAAFPGADQLLRFFALFHSLTGLAAFLVQAAASRFLLQRFGLGKAAATLPWLVALGSLTGIWFPLLPIFMLGRAAEVVTRNSLFRSAYELFYTPLPATEKRMAKPLVDVGVERLGDMLGGGLVRLLVWLVTGAQNVLLTAAAVLGIFGWMLARRLQSGYVAELERSLRSRAFALDPQAALERTTRTLLMKTFADVDIGLQMAPRLAVSPSFPPAEALPAGEEPLRQAIVSGDPERVRSLLAKLETLDESTGQELISLLAWDDVSRDVIQLLQERGAPLAPLLIKHLLDHGEEFTIRRRIPRALVKLEDPAVVEALYRGLNDPRFEVRYQCGVALSRMSDACPAPSFPPERVYAVVLREIQVGRRVWESYRLLDQSTEEESSPLVDAYLKRRTRLAVEHLFTILSLALPREPLRISLQALHTSDPVLQGTALEYLESMLPVEVWQKVQPLLEVEPSRHRPSRSREEILKDLFQSHQSIAANLQELMQRED